MYKNLKNILFQFLPKSFVYQNEFLLRSISFHLFYKGKKCYCNVCEKELKSFVLSHNGQDKLCPYCGSLPRTRVLWQYLKEKQDIETRKIKVLDFSPQRYFKKRFKALNNITYVDSDYESKSCLKNYDICNIDEADETYDLIICYHVLEHVKNDKKAMSELYRILKPAGNLLIQVPFNKEEMTIEEGKEELSAELRKELFGQDDHVRIYYLNDLVERLKISSFQVEILQFAKNNPIFSNMGVNENDTILVCKKP